MLGALFSFNPPQLLPMVCPGEMEGTRRVRCNDVSLLRANVNAAPQSRCPHSLSSELEEAGSPESQLEVVLFWIVGMVTTILSGAVAIYADHYHLWN
jgi:hypothetical protein